MGRSEPIIAGRHRAPFSRVAVLGAGTMGRGIAAVLAGHGIRVDLHDPDAGTLERAVAHVRAHAPEAVVCGHAEIEPAVRHAELVVESALEDLELKRHVIAGALACSPEAAAVASNTSSFDIDDLSPGSPRVLGVHWFNPPEVVPGVEVVPGRSTAPEHVERAVALLRALDKEPVVVANVPGFIANRLQEAMVAEALRCVGAGWASPADVDAIVRTTFGPRLAVLGPFEVVDEGGLEVERSALAQLHATTGGDVYRVPPVLDELVEAGRTGTAAGAGLHEYGGDPAAVTARRRQRVSEAFAVARGATAHNGWKENRRMDHDGATNGDQGGELPRAQIRLRFGPADARYGDDLVDGGRLMQLFGDLATELSILLDGDEGLFRAYENVEFLAPVRAHEFIEAEAWVIRLGNTSRTFGFEARRRVAPTPEHGPTAAELMPEPEVVARATGTVVVPAERQRLGRTPQSNDRPLAGLEEGSR
ncbi:MAG TPA: 3-hydroxyacyl-CoA dehydrogenase NAD-binding domain-containing protein [Baekduia sp.]|nr:3-hydroxyacyl-CoA dehydrogenase NAD-binding domain-containing protein [Baekduia sp.]